jgi:hypothetical protein
VACGEQCAHGGELVPVEGVELGEEFLACGVGGLEPGQQVGLAVLVEQVGDGGGMLGHERESLRPDCTGRRRILIREFSVVLGHLGMPGRG